MESAIGEFHIREAVLPESAGIIYIIKEGSHVALTEKQKKYNNAKDIVFSPNITLTRERVGNLLTAKKEELIEAIQTSPLKEITNRNGYQLGSLLELTNLAVKEFNGEMKAKTVLQRVLEIETDQRDVEIQRKAKDLVREGLVVKNNGSIYTQSFPNQDIRENASREAQFMKSDFLRAKDRLESFAKSL